MNPSTVSRSSARRRASLFRAVSPLLLVALTGLLLAGCGSKKQAAGAPAGPGGPGGSGVPAEVGVITLASAPVTLTRELPGRTSAFRVAEVRARVSGIVLKRLYREG